MIKRMRVVTLGIACLALGAAFGPTFAGAAIDSVKDVVVKNDATQPVPTKPIGTTTVEGTVGVAGTPRVKVANETGEPIPVTSVDTGPRVTPVAHQVQFSFSGAPDDQESYAVPAGKRLTIDLVTFHDLNRTVGIRELMVTATTGGETVRHYLSTSTQADSADVATDQVNITADGGTDVAFFVQLTGGLGGGTNYMYGSFAGTLTDA
jgi:hypothetical protein